MPSDHRVDELFGLLSDETRVDIIRSIALAEAELDQTGAGPISLSFSDIYDRVAVDNTSKLSYHLGELDGTYVRKGDDGYDLTHAGERMARFILAGNYEQPTNFDAHPVDGVCPFCGAESLTASLVHQFFRIDCTACDRQVTGQPVTPAQTETRDVEALVESVGTTAGRDHRQIRRRVCPECSGHLAVSVQNMPDSPLPDADPFIVTSQCEACLRKYNAPMTYSVAYHPAAIAFHWERGFDVLGEPPWAFNEYLVEGRWSAERDPSEAGEYRVGFRHDDISLRVWLDDEVSVVRTERVRRR